MLPTIPYLTPPEIQIPAIVRPVEEKPKEDVYVVQKGDTLTKIAREQRTSVLRLFYKNKSIKHPDQLKPGTKLVIPSKDEKLKKRDIIESAFRIQPPQDSPRSGGYSNSNTYSVGYCTWYVKNRRPDIPNGWHDASNWFYAAQSMGWPTGSVPRVGAVAWESNHVAYVTSVSGDMVTVSEMNYTGWNQVSSRTAPASSFRYIY